MNQPLTRRGFLARSGGLCAGAALAGPLCQAALAAEKRRTWPLATRDAMLTHLGQPDSWSALKAVGAEGIEVVINDDLSLPVLFHPAGKYTAATPAGIQRLGADLRAAGRRITAFCTFNRFDERPEAEIKWLGQVARIAQPLGVSTIRIDVVPHKLPGHEFLKLAIVTLKKVLADTEASGVRLAIENHGSTTNDPEFLNPLFDGVGSDRLGLTLDTGNFYWFGHPLSKLYQLFETFAPRVFHTHCKGIHYPVADRERQRPMGWKYDQYQCPIYEADVDFARVAAILDKAGYAGDLCVENEALGKLAAQEAAATLSKEITLLKGLRAKLNRG
jgi:sugar phosphate isomerase/epimerase